MSDKIEINEYLFYEFGFDLDESEDEISEEYPYELHYMGDLEIDGGKIKVFEFIDGEKSNVVLYGNGISTYERMGMEVSDIHAQILGSRWIGEREPIDLNTTKIGYDNIPPLKTRKAEIEKLVFDKLWVKENVFVLEGLFLTKVQNYLALVQCDNEKFIIGHGIDEKIEKFNHLSNWRLLSWGIGRLVNKGILK